MVIPCIKLRNEIAEKIKEDIAGLHSRGVTPSFAIIQIGDNPASNIYIQVKTKKAKELGIETKIYKFEQLNDRTIEQINKQQKEIEKLITKLNTDSSIHGIIIQRPLPKSYDEHHLQFLINPQKDIDGLSENSPFINPLVQAVLHAIKHVLSQSNPYSLPTTTYNLVVVGKGKSAGSPIFNYFSSHPNIHLRTTDYVLRTSQIDSHTPNPTEILKSADLIISCVGKERIINANNIKEGVILISVGQHQPKSSNFQFQISKEYKNFNIKKFIKNLKLKIKNLGKHKQKQIWLGDYNEDEIKNIAQSYTRTPGGIGPLNVIFLLQNVISSSQNI
jgi:methylenetetrahydrofolate dehydrogenase (NADP+) / methenyltetrahydrofolate cyclohydrolase